MHRLENITFMVVLYVFNARECDVQKRTHFERTYF